MDPSSFLKSLEILSDLNDQEISFLASKAQWIDYEPSAPVIKRGEIGRFLWIVYEGEVKVMIPAVGATGESSETLKRGALFGEMSVMTGEPEIADVLTLTACKLIKIPRESFSQLIAGNPKTLAKFARLITDRMIQNAQAASRPDLLRVAHQENQDPYDLNFSSAAEPMKILVLNCGSSSMKYSLFDTVQALPLLEGEIEKIGSGDAVHKVNTPRTNRKDDQKNVMTMKDAFDVMLRTVTDCSRRRGLRECRPHQRRRHPIDPCVLRPCAAA